MKLNRSLLMLALAACAMGAQAKYNGEDRGKPVMPSEINAKMQAECSGCHMAYPAGLLPAASWKKLMAGLEKHFGTDASLSPQDTNEITSYVLKYASNRGTSSAAPLRITDGEWFKNKHDSSEITPAIWKRESIKSQGNCSACHQGAERGDFNEHRIRIPQ